VLTNGGSRVVASLLQKAADEKGGPSAVRFKVIYVLSPAKATDGNASGEPEGMETVRALRAKGVPVATIPESAVAYALGKADVVIVGAEGVVENGGIVSRMGTYQIGLLAKAMGKPFYVVAESHKFVRVYPLGQYDLPIEQDVIDYRTAEDLSDDSSQQSLAHSSDVVDFTPPHLISALITDSGVLTPSAVSEELIKIWF
jgi:translation initiation factor eIF-2B subunit alpha